MHATTSSSMKEGNVQDPIARVFSAWKMSKKMACRDQVKEHPTEPCMYPVFAEMVLAEVALLEKQGCAFNRKVWLCSCTLCKP
jgi:hypothetical protein